MTTQRPLLILTIVILALASGAGGAALVNALDTPQKPSTNDLIRDFYQVENAVHVSPHGMRVKMAQGVTDFILVDLRSAEEYETEHIAINIPAYSDKATSAYGDVERIVSAFRALPPGKEVIVYCYSTPCMTGRKIGKMLVEHDIYVKHLGIGWNEWRHFWNLWNHEWEWDVTKVEDYIASGKEPGTPKRAPLDPTQPCVIGQFGC